MPPEIATLFNDIRAVYTRHGFNLYTPWESWSTLNEYYPSPKSLGEGQFIQTDENNRFEKFSSHLGSHPVLGSHSYRGGMGDLHQLAFQSLTDLLGLELVLDVDGENIMTYKGKRNRYYKITKNA